MDAEVAYGFHHARDKKSKLTRGLVSNEVLFSLLLNLFSLEFVIVAPAFHLLFLVTWLGIWHLSHIFMLVHAKFQVLKKNPAKMLSLLFIHI
ncbi:hypothetical protein KFK09_023452 [Dendrobium nobile]|uniref:Uncharacterized protein n=1 Tax=Dendrobium nobile TaxID=94219 RepID=A0A8T3AM67_DENNO|nr:hypothetical protein KFK09_023452 [Dendrobium nobile]